MLLSHKLVEDNIYYRLMSSFNAAVNNQNAHRELDTSKSDSEGE
jgi:hypothetical protein